MTFKLFLLYSKSPKNAKCPVSSFFNKFYFAFGKFIDALKKKTADVVSLQTVYSIFFTLKMCFAPTCGHIPKLWQGCGVVSLLEADRV